MTKSVATQDQMKANEDEEDSGNTRCVVSCLQPCVKVSVFTGIYSCVMLLLACVPAYITSQLTSVEKQFNLNSTKSGIVISAHDIGYLVSVLIATHFAKRLHIPRALGCFAIGFGLCAALLSIPNFIAPKHLQEYSTDSNESQQLKYICKDSNISEKPLTKSLVEDSSDEQTWVLSFFITVLILMGAVGAPRMPLITMYIDNNVTDKAKTSYSVGVLIGMATFGPTLSLLLGSLFAKLPVDLSETFITQSDPRWIGAWWLGFIVFGLTLILVAIPLLLFPRSLPGAPKSDSSSNVGAFGQVKDLPLSIWRLLTNPVYILSLFSRCVHMFALMGLASFGPKYLQYQFNLPAYKANYALGLSHVVTSTFGTVIGGILTGKLRLSRSGCAKLVIIAHVLAAAFQSCNFIFGCQNTNIEGIDFFMTKNSSSESLCFCDDSNFLLSCGSDGVTYSSPCRAGCWNVTDDIFGGCGSAGGTATPGMCDNGCPYMIPYLVMGVLTVAVGTLGIIPNYILFIRSVDDNDKAMAIGVIDFVTQLLGFLPAPIVYGKLIDTSCRYLSPGGSEVCSVFDIVDLRYKVHGMEIGLKGLSVVMLFIVWHLCKRAEEKEQTKDEINTKHAVQNGEKA